MIDRKLLNILTEITPEEKKILDGKKSIDTEIYMSKQDGVINNKKILSDGSLIAIRPHTRFVHFPLHSHDYVEIVYMCSGSLTHIVDGEKILLGEGELLFLCQSARHEILPAGKNDVAVNFIVLPEFFDTVLKMLGQEDTPLKSFIIDCLRGKKAKSGYLHFKVSDILPVQNLTENLIWSLINDRTDERGINRITVGLLFLQLISFSERIVHGELSGEITVRALKYIEENYKSGSLKALAAQLHYDAGSVSREIKKKTGKTYTELVREKRLSHACYLLENTDMTVEEAAMGAGYENISFFYRIFRNKYGITPREYRMR